MLRLARVDSRALPHLLKAQVTVEKTSEARWRLKLVTEFAGVSGERIFSGNSCRAVTDASVLTLALILNPDVEPAREPPSVEAPPSEPLRVSSVHGTGVPDRASGKSKTEMERRKLVWLGASYVGFQAGVLKKPGPEFAIGLGTLLGRASAWVLGSYVYDFTSAITPCVRYEGCRPDDPVVWCPTTGEGHTDEVPITTLGLWLFFSQL